MKHIVLNILLLFALITNAQDIKRTAIWYFGENAGIDFNTTPPTPLTDGQVNTIEGCASICDTNGNLLFYTDGRTVWNKYHDTMPNGSGLFGNESSGNGVLIVPKPLTDSLYYIFYTDAQGGANGFNYSIVNVKTNNDSGIIVSKNKRLIGQVCEAIAATRHQNGQDFWIVVHEYNSSNFHSYLVTNEGIIDCSVISNVGSKIENDIFLAQNVLKISINGDLLANSFYDFNSKVEVFNFNKQTGEVTYKYLLNGLSLPSGVEFSPNSNVIYISERDKALNQFNLTSEDQNSINSSRIKLYVPVGYSIYGLEQAPNQKIYLSSNGLQHLSCINYPDSIGVASNFIFDDINLKNKISKVGLPNFVSSFFYQSSIDFSYTHDCRTNTLAFAGYDTINASTYKWYFSKGNIKDSASTKNTTYIFADTGNYAVTFIASNTNRLDTVTKEIYIYPKFTLNLGKDTVVCATPFTLNAGNGQFCYTWQDSSSNASFDVNQSGTYHVKVVSQNHCNQLDTINITVAPPPAKPTITRNNDTLISSLSHSYQWYKNNNTINGATQREYKITQNGVYTVETTDSNGCKSTSNNFSYIWVGIEKINAGQTFLVYPNSTNNVLFIDKPVGINTYLLKILDIQGKRLITKELFKETEEIDLTAIAEGIYLLQITINGKLQETHKLIIKK